MKINDILRVLLILELFLAGCSGSIKPVTGASRAHFPKAEGNVSAELKSVHSVVLLPALVDSAARSCVLGLDLDREVNSAFRSEVGIDVASHEKVLDNWRATSVNESQFAKAAKLAALSGADAGLIAHLSSCERGSGSKLGGDSSAYVTIEMLLIGAKEANEIWRGGYSNRQQPLSENLLKLDEKLKHPHFRSADELVLAGVRSSLRDLEVARTELFLRESPR